MAISCIECNMMDTEEEFWEVHQQLPTRLWCVNKKVEEMTRMIVNRYKSEVRAKYGNRKRHRQ